MHIKNKLKFITVMSSLALITLGAAGCHHRGLLDPDPPTYDSVNLEDRHPIEVYKKGTRVKLHIRSTATKLSYRQRAKVQRFLRSYKRYGEGKIEIAAPTGAANELATFKALKQIRSLVKAYSITSSSIDFIPYNAKSKRQPAIYMMYGKYVAKGPDCDEWPNNVSKNPSNRHYYNYGCSQQRNLAAMIANPRDLIKPRGSLSPRSSERRDVTWDKYIKGETTASQKSNEDKSTVSDVAKN